MKNLFLLILVAVLFAACSTKTTGPEPVSFGGEVLNPKDSVVYLKQLGTSIQDVMEGKVIDTFVLDTNNGIDVKINRNEGLYRIIHGRSFFDVYLAPGKSLYFQFDAANPYETIAFQGKLKKAATYLYERSNVLNELQKQRTAMYALSENEFLAKVDSSRQLLDSMLVQFSTNNSRFNESFIKNQGLSNYYITAIWMVQYPKYRVYYSQADSIAPLSPGYKATLAAIDLNDSSSAHIPAYISFLGAKHEALVSEYYEAHLEEAEADRFAYYKSKWNIADSLFSVPIFSDYFRYTSIRDMVRYESPELDQNLIEGFNKHVKTIAFIEDVNTSIAAWDHLQKGMKAPGFNYESIDGGTVALDSLLGNYVYIDVWATWCGPCKREIPYLKNLERTFHDQPVRFVSVSIDENKRAWRKMVTEQELSGIQLFAEGAWKSTITEQYNINGIPRFMLIDPEGNLISANASRPSGDIEEVLNELLEIN